MIQFSKCWTRKLVHQWFDSVSGYQIYYKTKRAVGIEPTPKAWEASVLPLNYARIRNNSSKFLCIKPSEVLSKDKERLA